MPKKHKVRPGDCVSSLADKYGFAVDTLWDHSDNNALRAERRDANVLAFGDVVTVPDLEPAGIEVNAGGKCRFILNNTHVTFRLVLERGGEPIVDEAYLLRVGQDEFEGTTDDKGAVEAQIPAASTIATLILPQRAQQYELRLGHLAPALTYLGAAQRLRNIGVFHGAEGTESTPSIRLALRLFQRMVSLTPTGELDDATASALEDRHGC